jgi:hypothetical protein
VIKYARLCNGYGEIKSPAIMVYGGSIHSGKWKGESLNIVSAFEVGKNSITRLLLRTLRVFKTSWSRCLRRNVYSKYHVFSYQALGMSL